MRAPPRGLIREKVCTVGFLSQCWHHRLDGWEIEQALRVGDDREAWDAAVHGIAKS